MFAIQSRSLKRPHRPLSRIGGFSLVEIMITLAIAVILVLVAVPQYQSTIQSQKTSSGINNLLNDLEFTRSEAIKEGQFVSICVSSGGTSCTTSSTWDQGWIVYTNPSASNSSSQTFAAGTSVILRMQPALPSGYTMATNPAGTTQVTFTRDGFSNDSTGASLNALFTLSTTATNTSATRCLWLDQLGRQYGGQKHGQAAAPGQSTSCT
jgi:type IV fimbrial biogenesis protein FimT